MSAEEDRTRADELAAEVATAAEGDLDSSNNNRPRGWHDVELTLREIRSVQLRAAGASYDQIAESVGYANRSAAFKAVRRALQRWGSEAVEELRVLELTRLDQITQKLWPQILGKPATDHGDGRIDPPVAPDLKAMDLYLKVSQRRAKLLGLDAPTMLDLVPQGDTETAGGRTVEDFERFVEIVNSLSEAEADDADHATAEAGGGAAGRETADDPVLPTQSG